MSLSAQASQGLIPFNFEMEMLRCWKNLKANALKLTRNAEKAEDLVQETFLRALANRHQFKPGTSMSAWLFTIQRNSFFSTARKSGREVEGDDVFWNKLAETHAAEPTHAERLDLERVLQEMPPGKLAVVLDSDAYGLTLVQQAQKHAVAEGTVKSRVSRTREMLRNMLGEAYATSKHRYNQPIRSRTRSKPMLAIVEDTENRTAPANISGEEALRSLLSYAVTNRANFNYKVEEAMKLASAKGVRKSKRQLGKAMVEAGIENHPSVATNIFGGRSSWNQRRLVLLLEYLDTTALEFLAVIRPVPSAQPAPPPQPAEVVSLPLAARPQAPPPAAESLPPPAPVESAPQKAAQPTTVEAMATVVKHLLKERLASLNNDQSAQLLLLGDLVHRLTR